MPASSSSPSPLLLALREGTRDCHKALEARLPFFEASFDVAAYSRLIQAYYGFHAPLEARLGAYQEPMRTKTPTLTLDLQALSLSAADIDALPLCQALPAISSEASALGVMYVLEGSTLGGQVLKRAMAERLGLGPAAGTGFFRRVRRSDWQLLAQLPRPARPGVGYPCSAGRDRAGRHRDVPVLRKLAWATPRAELKRPTQANTCSPPHAGSRPTNPTASRGQ